MLARGARTGPLILLTMLLAACAARPVRVHEPTARSWPERLRALQALEHFELGGRLAASNGTDAFSAGVHWRQQGEDAVIDLSGPLGLGAAHIVRHGASLSVTNAQGVVYRGSPAGEQMASTLGFDPPLASLRYWVLGVPDPARPADEKLDPGRQRLSALEQDGWRIDYGDYVAVGSEWLPARLTLERADVRVKLLVDDWQS